jgi:hypothetical protein
MAVAGTTSKIVLCSVMMPFACGGDDVEEGTTPTSVGAPATATTGGDDTTGTTDSSTSLGGTSTSADTTTGPDESDTSEGGTGDPSDPSYPPVGGDGTCPDGASLMLPGASVCAPFCAGPDAACPDAATGTATATCTPFEMDGGSGTPCRAHEDCPDAEACSVADTCIAVAFWGCRLLCDAAECPDAMICSSVGACGYPS